MKKEESLKLSIIVPVYNVEKYLERCVDSLLYQDIDKSEYEIILINDGSTDRSYEIAQQLKSKHGNIVLLSQENKGQSAARNVGLDIARGKYIMFVDSDDILEPNVLKNLVVVSEKNSLDLCFYSTVFEYEDGRKRWEKQTKFKEETVYDGEYLVLNGMNISSVWQCLFSHTFLVNSQVRFYEGIIHEDVDFCFRLFPLAKKVIFTNIFVYHYFVWRENSILTNSPIKLKKQITSNLQVAYNTKQAVNKDCYSVDIRKYICKHMNSLVVINLLRLIRDKRLDLKIRKDCFSMAKTLGVYPIYGQANTWKTTLLGGFISVEWLFKMLMRVTCVK